MTVSSSVNSEELVVGELSPDTYFRSFHLNRAVVSWGAVIAGATAAAILSLILLLLGVGLGLSSISPWAHKGVSASAFGISTIVWLTVTAILSSGMGGYLAGRLRTRWTGVHIDEVYFRDTAHGFLSWAVATLSTAALLTSAIGTIAGGGVQTAANLAGGAATAAVALSGATGGSGNSHSNSISNELGYFVDSLFRSGPNSPSIEGSSSVAVTTSQSNLTSEVRRIFINSIDTKTLPPADITQVGQLISKNTGLSQEEAERRVNEVYNNMLKKMADAELAAKNAAEKARKATIYATLWLFVSLLMGAFSASLAATCGGRSRDAEFINQPSNY